MEILCDLCDIVWYELLYVNELVWSNVNVPGQEHCVDVWLNMISNWGGRNCIFSLLRDDLFNLKFSELGTLLCVLYINFERL